MDRREYMREYMRKRRANPKLYKQDREQSKTYYETHIAEIRQKAKDLKREVISHYGGKCSCPKCGEHRLGFLTIDHVNNDGAKHRKEIVRGGWSFYVWLKKHNYPEGFQAMCYNCNCGRAKNSNICPHVTEL